MRIGIDISQLAYPNTGVATFLSKLVHSLIKTDSQNEYILFYSSLGKEFSVSNFQFSNKSKFKNVQIKQFKMPPTLLDILWNKLHIVPIEWFVGDIDVFITSDWTEPPVKKAKKATIIYDLIVYKHPEETDQKIISTQKRKLNWVKKESDIVFCISESTKKDVMQILGMDERKIKVIYPGI